MKPSSNANGLLLSSSILSYSSSNEPDSTSTLPPSSCDPSLEFRIKYATSYSYPDGCKLSSNKIETFAGVDDPVEDDDASRTSLSPPIWPVS